MDHMSHTRCVAKSKLQALQDLRPFGRVLGSCLTLFGLGVGSSPFSRISFYCLFLMWFKFGLQAEVVPIQNFIARKTLPLNASKCKHCQDPGRARVLRFKASEHLRCGGQVCASEVCVEDAHYKALDIERTD